MTAASLAIMADDDPPERRRKQDVQLDRIEQQLDAVREEVRKINGSVRRHEHILTGHDGRHGLVHDVRDLRERTDRALQRVREYEALAGMVSSRTLWGAVGAIAGVASVVVALVVGLL